MKPNLWESVLEMNSYGNKKEQDIHVVYSVIQEVAAGII